MLRSKEIKAGIPDLAVVHRGKFIGIELKIKPNKLSKIQKAVHKDLMLAGALTVTCYSLRDVHDFLALIVPLVHDV